MKIRGILPVSLTLAVMLSGCDKIPLTPQDAIKAAEPFGAASRERVGDSDSGAIYRMTIESRRPASWLEARRFIGRQIAHPCPDGQKPASITHDPAVDYSSTDDQTREYPAGTLFTQTVTCPGRPAFEFDFPPGTSQEDAQREMYRRLKASGLEPGMRPIVYPVFSWRESPKYEQVEQLLGRYIHSQATECPSGVTAREFMIGNLVPDASVGQGAISYFGVLTECAEERAATTAHESDPSP